VSPLVIECYFPYDYDTANLRNETAYFEVYIEKVQQYESPEFNDDFVLEIINAEESEVTLDMLNEYEGDSLTEKLRAYIEASIYEEYEAIYDEKVAKAVWEKCLLDADVKRYPGKIVDEVYRGYEADVYQKYNETGGSIKNSYTEEYEHFEDVDSFAMAYLSLGYSKYDDWKEYLYDMSKSLVKERLVMHYLIQNEGLRLTDEEYAAQYEITYQETLDLYMELYYEKNGTSRKDYTDEEYEALVAEGVEQLKLLNKDYFPETIYYDILMNEMIKWPKVSTLDDRRAYNFE
jgi:FKBP-type peptidyl-prolyl cis-trans isomerase (trigger factor)